MFVVCATLLAARDARAVEGGAIDTDRRSVVALCEGDDARDCTLRCSGALLTPNLVLTARHCVTNRGDKPVDCVRQIEQPVTLAAARVWVTPSTTDIGRAAVLRQGRRFFVPASADVCGHDLALLALASAFEASEATPLAPFVDASLVRGLAAAGTTVIGYGKAAGEPAGTRRSRSGVPLVCVGGADACRAVQGGDSLVEGELLVDAIACPGDSGGPLLIGAPGVVVGALSRTLESKDGCGLAVYAGLGHHALLLARSARQAAAAASPALPIPPWVLEAERLGNGGPNGPRAFGSPCDADEDCQSNTCRSVDDGFTWTCSMPCEAGCPSGASCKPTSKGQACFADPPRPADGCNVVSPAARLEGTTMLVVFACGIALMARSRRRRP